MDISFIFGLLILLVSVVIHEVSHGYAALFLGDHTAEYEGRLTLNPIKHIDPFGTIILPLIFILLPGGFIFGWAKPVPYNPYNLKNQRWGEAIVAFAGPLSNILIAVVFGLIIRFVPSVINNENLISILATTVFINLVLAFFNLIPMPPLDGSKILWSVLPAKFLHIREKLEKMGFLLVLLIAIFLWQMIIPLISLMFSFITGVGF